MCDPTALEDDPGEWQDCPECDGVGSLVIENEHGEEEEVTCPNCAGEGLIEPIP
jgi:DnaJ-class molecular chaperone